MATPSGATPRRRGQGLRASGLTPAPRSGHRPGGPPVDGRRLRRFKSKHDLLRRSRRPAHRQRGPLSARGDRPGRRPDHPPRWHPQTNPVGRRGVRLEAFVTAGESRRWPPPSPKPRPSGAHAVAAPCGRARGRWHRRLRHRPGGRPLFVRALHLGLLLQRARLPTLLTQRVGDLITRIVASFGAGEPTQRTGRKR